VCVVAFEVAHEKQIRELVQVHMSTACMKGNQIFVEKLEFSFFSLFSSRIECFRINLLPHSLTFLQLFIMNIKCTFQQSNIYMHIDLPHTHTHEKKIVHTNKQSSGSQKAYLCDALAGATTKNRFTSCNRKRAKHTPTSNGNHSLAPSRKRRTTTTGSFFSLSRTR
jgi:hypothetical protein